MAAQSISLSSYVKLLRGNANFRRLWIAQIISEVGDWFYMVALYAMLLEFTGRAELLGIARETLRTKMKKFGIEGQEE